ncbi:AMP-binding protein [Bacillus sp. JJ1566]|uniref:phenylacetate--CoA ligase family protein n=1 Tax=Bacillus sp. JJ1566 TaxID=3122961 RepID=UPI0030004D20
MASIQETVSYAYEHAEGFRRLMDIAGLSPQEILTEDDLVKIPVLKKERLPDLQSNLTPFAGLTTVPATDMVRIFMSPGPIYDPQSTEEDFWRFSEALLAAGFKENDIVQNTFSYHLSPAGFMFDAALRKLGATVIPAGTGNRELQLQVIRDLRVTGYVGTPSFFAILLDAADEKGWTVGKEIAIQKVFFTAEMTTKELRKRCEEQGIQVFEGYGTADCGCVAFEDKQGPGLKVTNSAFVQICDPLTGEEVENGEGEVVITLFDKSYPLIRFGTGDLSRWIEGYEGKRIAGVLGRVSDGVKVKGMFVREKQLAAVLESEGINRFQAIVSKIENQDQLEIIIESENELSDQLVSRLQDVIRVRPIIKRVNIGSITKQEKLLIDHRILT